ncbi:glycosyltransferase family 4 protein [Mucilaginibacter sp. dw_454]|uniref:glycosyltransferase family 4 protein n=1 Tax=Mucilaginibacter sp. dw_454 TaxID=2720079 RepID=UPI001BD45A9B|nr:glycosyltransferase family 4 protein [Mucilaginibacter sp. dw_454]
MRILIVDELFYPLGGIQVRFKDLSEQWAKAGHTVIMTAIDHVGNLPEQEVINGVTYNRVMKDPNYYKSGRFGRKTGTILQYTYKLKSFFKQDWDLVIFGQFPMLPQVIYHYLYKKHDKTVLDFVEYRDSKLWKFINNIIINAADNVVCISEHVKECAMMYRKDNLYVIPSFVDTNKSKPESKTNYIFLGRMEEHKHPEVAIEVVISYNQTYNQNMQLMLVGGGNMLEGLKKKYGHISFINFLGAVDEEKKLEVLANGRMLIFPSEREGLPIVVIEAMSYGIPTVTTDFPGNGTQFFVKQEDIGLVALPNIKDLVAKVHELEENYDYYTTRCLEVKGNYDISLLSAKYLENLN